MTLFDYANAHPLWFTVLIIFMAGIAALTINALAVEVRRALAELALDNDEEDDDDDE